MDLAGRKDPDLQIAAAQWFVPFLMAIHCLLHLKRVVVSATHLYREANGAASLSRNHMRPVVSVLLRLFEERTPINAQAASALGTYSTCASILMPTNYVSSSAIGYR